MRAFRRVSQGLACGLDDWERELLARLALEVRAILQSDEPTDEDAGGSTVLPSTRSDPGRPGESERDREVLAALDFDLDQSSNHVHTGRPASDPVVGVLLPEASEDPVTAMEVSSLTRARLRSGKVDRLARMAAELRAPSGPEATVLVPIGQEAVQFLPLDPVGGQARVPRRIRVRHEEYEGTVRIEVGSVEVVVTGDGWLGALRVLRLLALGAPAR